MNENGQKTINKEKKKKRNKKYRETHKEQIKDYWKKYYEVHKEEKRKYLKKYREKNRDKLIKTAKMYRENNKDVFHEICKNYREKNKEKILEKLRKYREKNRDFCRLVNRVSKFYNSKYFQYFSSIENYLTIMKLEDYSLKMSIMVKLSRGSISEDEAILFSGMVWTEEDQKELNEYWKRSKNNRSSSKR